MHPTELAAVVIILAVAAITLALTGIALRAWRRTQNGKLLWVALAFGLFVLKSLVTAAALAFHTVGHEHLELVGSGFDLVIVGLLLSPLLIRK